MAVCYATFDTALGWCAVAWADAGLVGVWLPGSTRFATTRQVLERHPDALEQAPAGVVIDVVARITQLLAGHDVDLRDVALDDAATPVFDRRVYGVVRSLPRGVTMTYGEIARRLDAPGAAQAVGRAMAHNPWPIVVPCHRVVAADGGNGGFSAPGGVDTKLRMLAIEGATLF